MIGQTVSHYKILEKLGEGGMGVVFKAHDTKLDRMVALKFLPPYLSSDSGEKERFYHEARAASTLLHANVAVMFEVNEYEGRLFLSMEYVEGQTLKKLIEKGDPLPVRKVLDFAIQICEGLEAAHEKGVVHRDIKSDNIMVTTKGQIKLMDFGLAKIKGASKLTKAGSTLGTAAYMSPEQAQGEEVDRRSDIFSLGVVFYELLTGQLPFRGEHQAALMYSLINEEPQPIARFNPQVPQELERIVGKAMAKDREERYQHVDDLLADLRRERKNLEYARSGYVRTPVAAAGASVASSKKSRVPYYVVGGVVVVLVAALLLFNPFGVGVGTNKSASTDRKFIAVLPFTNLSDNKEDDAFCDGMTEDILTQLSKIGDLKVVSRSSIMRYKGTQKTSKEIGKELGVSSILEGSIRRSGNRLRITGQLVDAATDEQIWADNYDRDMKDVFEIQSEVAKSIAGALQAKLSPSEQASIERKQTDNVEAYGYYTKGRQYYYLYHGQDNERAIDLFKKALSLDPNYALAYAGLGDCYGQRVIKFGYSDEWIDSGLVAAQKSVALDAGLAEGYKALGLCYGANGFINRSLDAYYKAVERNPNYTPAVGNISIMNTVRGNFAEAFRWAIKDAKLSAVEPFTFQERGAIYYFLEEDEKSMKWVKQAEELQPDFVFAFLLNSHLHVGRGEYPEARAEVQKALSIQPEDPSSICIAATIESFAGDFRAASEMFRKTLEHPVRLGDITFRSNEAGLGFALMKLGRRTEGERLFDQIRARHQRDIERGSEVPLLRYELAAIAAVSGKRSEAYDWLKKAVDLGWRDYRLMQRDPMFAGLQSDAQFTSLIEDVKSKVAEQRKLVDDIERQ